MHDVSHVCTQLRNPKARPHEGDRHRLELEIMQYVKAGWLTGSLRDKVKPKSTIDQRCAADYDRLLAGARYGRLGRSVRRRCW